MTIGNPAFCLALYLTDVHFRGELQYVGRVGGQKIKYRPIRTRELGGVRLQKELNVRSFFFIVACAFDSKECIQKVLKYFYI